MTPPPAAPASGACPAAAPPASPPCARVPRLRERTSPGRSAPIRAPARAPAAARRQCAAPAPVLRRRPPAAPASAPAAWPRRSAVRRRWLVRLLARRALTRLGRSCQRRRLLAVAPPRRQLARGQQLGLDLDLLRHEDGGVELVEVAAPVPGQRRLVVLGYLEHEMGAATYPCQVLQLIEDEAA